MLKLSYIAHILSNDYIIMQRNFRSPLTFKVVAVAASKINKPVRLMLDRDDDMVISGTRYVYI